MSHNGQLPTISSEDRASRRRVLIISFYYPPDLSSSGVLRTLKFSKYLPEFGWQPVVLTVRTNHYEKTDPALLDQIPPEVEIVRTPAINTKQHLGIGGKYLRALAVPDRFVGWWPFGFAAAVRLLKARRIDALYSTSPLATAHLIAWSLKLVYRLPWIADFRDPWLEPELESDPGAALFRLEKHLQGKVLKASDKLVFTTARLKDYVISQSKGLNSSKAVVIPNGYDDQDFRVIDCRPDKLPIRITHTGLVDASYRSPCGFLQGLAALISTGAVMRDEIRVDFIGGGMYAHSTEFQSLVSRLGLSNVVSAVSPLPYSECLERQAKSHILLLLQCGEDTQTLIPAKLFEYLRAGRPVLAVTHKSASAELLQEVGGGTVVNPDDPSAMIEALRAMIGAARSGLWATKINVGVLESYTRRRLSERLASELDSIVEQDTSAKDRW